MSPARSHIRIAVLLIVGGLALTGCAEMDDPEILSRESSSGTADSAAKPQDPPSPEPSEALDEVKAVTPGECLIGAWTADNDAFAAQMAALTGGAGSVDSVSGDVTLTLTADGETNTNYVDWTIVMTTEGQQVQMVRNGTDFGTYAVEGDARITMTETTSDSQLDMFMNGAAAGTVPATDTLPVTSADFTCTDSALTIVSDLTNIEFTRQ